jgi:hypothetical protein
MARVIAHHAHHPDEGIYRLVHAEQDEVTFYDTEQPAPRAQTFLLPNPDFVTPPPEGEDDTRTKEEKQEYIEEEMEVTDPPNFVERTEIVQYDHKEIVWDATDKRWEGMSDQEIAEVQRGEVHKALAKDKAAASKEAKAAARREKSTKHFDGVGDTL